MTWGGADPVTGLLDSVYGVLAAVRRTGRVVIRKEDGTQAHGNAAGVYVKGRPLVRRIATNARLRMYLNGIQDCPLCESPCAREDFATQYLGDTKAITYLYCGFCDVGFKIWWEFQQGQWVDAYLARLTPTLNPESFAAFQAELEAARTAA